MHEKKTIWVPAEATDGALYVTDVGTDHVYPVTRGIGDLSYEHRGRDRRCKAAPGELVRVETSRSGKELAVVRIEGGHQIVTPVLGPWHLAGLAAPPVPHAEQSRNGACRT